MVLVDPLFTEYANSSFEITGQFWEILRRWQKFWKTKTLYLINTVGFIACDSQFHQTPFCCRQHTPWSLFQAVHQTFPSVLRFLPIKSKNSFNIMFHVASNSDISSEYEINGKILFVMLSKYFHDKQYISTEEKFLQHQVSSEIIWKNNRLALFSDETSEMYTRITANMVDPLDIYMISHYA